MTYQLRFVIISSALVAAFAIPTADAGGSFGLHIGSGGFGVSVGVGDWGVYTNGWSNPSWSLSFNATLNGYGEWVTVGGLGTVWRPWVAVGWRPYTYGRWVHTYSGWTWVAYEPWGYIPHHYGRWALCDFGWVWVPGYTYSPANVIWVRAGGYVGWYARPPRGWSHAARGYHHGYRHGYRHGYDDGYWRGWNDARHATYVDWHHLGSDNISHYSVRHSAVSRHNVVDRASTPTPSEVRRRGGVSVTETRLSRRDITVDGHRVTVARPEGVARSIERHASQTAADALSQNAIQRRQPNVRSRPSASHIERGRSAGNRSGSNAARPRVRSSSDLQSGTAPERQVGDGAGRYRTGPWNQIADRSRSDDLGSATSRRQTSASQGDATSRETQRRPSVRNESRRDTASSSRSRRSRIDSRSDPSDSTRNRRDVELHDRIRERRSGAGRTPTRGPAVGSRPSSRAVPESASAEPRGARSRDSKKSRSKKESSPPRSR